MAPAAQIDFWRLENSSTSGNGRGEQLWSFAEHGNRLSVSGAGRNGALQLLPRDYFNNVAASLFHGIEQHTHTAKAVDDLYVQNPPSLFGPLTLDLDASSVSKSARSQDDRFCANENTFMTNIPIIATSPVNDLRADRRREQTNTAPLRTRKGQPNGRTKWNYG